MEKSQFYNIYFDYEDCKPPQYLGTTNNLNKWLKQNNENNGREEPEKLEDFIIENCELYFY